MAFRRPHIVWLRKAILFLSVHAVSTAAHISSDCVHETLIRFTVFAAAVRFYRAVFPAAQRQIDCNLP